MSVCFDLHLCLFFCRYKPGFGAQTAIVLFSKSITAAGVITGRGIIAGCLSLLPMEKLAYWESDHGIY